MAAAAAHSRGTALSLRLRPRHCLSVLGRSVYVFCITVGRGGGGGGGDQSVVQLEKIEQGKSVKKRTRTRLRQAHRYCLHIITLPYRLHLSAQQLRAPNMFT